MLLNVLKERLSEEYSLLRISLIASDLSARDILDRMEEIVWKQEIVRLFRTMSHARFKYPDEMISWILDKDDALDFIYQIWKAADYKILESFSVLLYEELLCKKEKTDE